MAEREEYEYRVEDRSILTPHFKRFVWAPMLRLVPFRTSANTLSLLGTFSSFAAFASVFIIPPEHEILYLIPAVFIFGYLCFDNIDGPHARRTKQNSPLGEFIDHWLDTLNNGFIIWGVCHVAQLPAWLILVTVVLGNVAFFATFWEQYHLGTVQMDRVGNVEGLVVVVSMYTLYALAGVDFMSRTPLVWSLAFIHGVVIIMFVVTMTTSASCVRRVAGHFLQWVPLLLTMGVLVAWYFLGSVTLAPIATAMAMCGALVGGRYVIGRVVDPPQGHLDFWISMVVAMVAALSLTFDPSVDVQGNLAWGAAGLIIVKVAWDFVSTVNQLRNHIRPNELLGRMFLVR